MSDSQHKLIAIGIIAVASFIALTSVWHDSPVVDEIPHIGASYSYITQHDARLNPEHPPLAKMLAGFALLPLHLNQSAFQTAFWTKDVNGQWEFGRRLIFNSGNDAIKLVHAAKLPMLLFFIFSAIIIYIWASELFGKRAGLIALILFAFSPNILAHSRFVTTDVPALFGVLFSTYFFIKFLRLPNWKSLVLGSVALGVALLTKFSTILLLPYFLLLTIIWLWFYAKSGFIAGILKTAVLFVLSFIIIVWPVYQYTTYNYPAERQRNDTAQILQSFGVPLVTKTIVWASDKPLIRPLAEYGLGLAMVGQRAEGGNRTFFLGKLINGSSRAYFPVVYFLKEPIPFWILVGLAFWAFFTHRKREEKKDEIHSFTIMAMILWLAIYWFTSILSNLNIGVRHLLPVFGFTYILVAGYVSKLFQNLPGRQAGSKPARPTGGFKILIFVLLVWYFAESIFAFPHYLSYFNELAIGGGQNYVADSNLDWGQDLWRLSDWVNENNVPRLYLDYFGWADPSYYLKEKYIFMRGGDYKSKAEFLKANSQGGYLAVSETFFVENVENPPMKYGWLESISPVTNIGHSILIWRIIP